MKVEKKNKIVKVLVVVAVLLSIGVLMPYHAHADGKTFVADFEGRIDLIAGNVQIVRQDNKVCVYNGLPKQNIEVFNLPHLVRLQITWHDWRGPQVETVVVECEEGVHEETYTIPKPQPDPKFA